MKMSFETLLNSKKTEKFDLLKTYPAKRRTSGKMMKRKMPYRKKKSMRKMPPWPLQLLPLLPALLQPSLQLRELPAAEPQELPLLLLFFQPPYGLLLLPLLSPLIA